MEFAIGIDPSIFLAYYPLVTPDIDERRDPAEAQVHRHHDGSGRISRQ